jgi:hypothetical protein
MLSPIRTNFPLQENPNVELFEAAINKITSMTKRLFSYSPPNPVSFQSYCANRQATGVNVLLVRSVSDYNRMPFGAKFIAIRKRELAALKRMLNLGAKVHSTESLKKMRRVTPFVFTNVTGKDNISDFKGS